jgi:hypothetical protein
MLLIRHLAKSNQNGKFKKVREISTQIPLLCINTKYSYYHPYTLMLTHIPKLSQNITINSNTSIMTLFKYL